MTKIVCVNLLKRSEDRSQECRWNLKLIWKGHIGRVRDKLMIMHFIKWLKDIIFFSLLKLTIYQYKWTNMSCLIFAVKKRTLLTSDVDWWFMTLIFIHIIIKVYSNRELSFQTHFLYFLSYCRFVKYLIKFVHIWSWHTLKLLIDLSCFFWWTIFYVFLLLNSSLNNTILRYGILLLTNYPLKVFIIMFILIGISFLFNFSILDTFIWNVHFGQIATFSDLTNLLVCLLRNQN